MITSKKAELDSALTEVLGKIDTGKVTCEDFNGLIQKALIGETTPEAVRDRLRRRTNRNATDSHIDAQTGHQPLTQPKLADRVQPRRQPLNQQNHGRAAIAHRHSARTQTQQGKYQPALEFINKHQGKPITEDVLKSNTDHASLKALATKLMSRSGTNRDWLFDLVQKLDK